MRSDPRSLLPLKPVDLQLLLALSSGEQHGYALVQAIEAGTDGLVKLDPGNLYRVIKRLLADGVIAESGRRRESGEPGEERRRYYELTAFGEHVLSAELRRLQSLLRRPEVRAIARNSAEAT
jgi:DNA-binding PadR family transcriptional regulator